MKAKEIIRRIKEIDDLSAVRFLEDVFMYGYVKGIGKGYDNAVKLARNESLSSDAEEAKRIFVLRYLNE